MARDIDAADLFDLAADLREAGAAGKVTDKVQKVNFKGAMNIKRQWQESAAGNSPRHAPAYPFSITFETTTSAGNAVETEIGPDKGRSQGALGNLLEFGSRNNPGFGDGQAAADAEEDRYLDALTKTMADLW